MSRVLKSSQIVLDKNTYKLPLFNPFNNIPLDNSKNQLKNNENADIAESVEEKRNEEAEALISKKIEEMNQLYKETINNANEEANKIISQAYEKSEEIMEQSRQDGFLEGKNAGFEEGKAAADSIIHEALAIKKQAEANMSSLISELEEDIIKLTISTAEKILNKKIEEEYDTILNLIKLGLEKCAFTEDLVLRVSIDDYDFAISSKDKILALSQNINDIIIRQDKSLVKGSCIIDTPSGSIDSSIDTQFNQVKEMYEELLRSE